MAVTSASALGACVDTILDPPAPVPPGRYVLATVDGASLPYIGPTASLQLRADTLVLFPDGRFEQVQHSTFVGPGQPQPHRSAYSGTTRVARGGIYVLYRNGEVRRLYRRTDRARPLGLTSKGCYLAESSCVWRLVEEIEAP